MEGEPNKERKIKTSEVAEILRLKSFNNPEAKKLFLDWTIQREKETDKGTPKNRITFNMERADLYLAVGDTEGALDALDDARRQALQHSETDLYDKIMNMMGKL